MNIGDFDLESTFDFQFTTTVAAVPTTLVGGSLSAYAGNDTTEILAGLTLTTDFDGKVGTHNVRVVATAANGYLAATNYTLWLAAGTVGGVTVSPCALAIFSIANRVARSGAVNAAALLDLANAIETGLTVRQAMRLGAAADAGLVSGAGTANVEITNAGPQDTVRIDATVDILGNRSAVTTDVT
jgi:hypothetical protein